MRRLLWLIYIQKIGNGIYAATSVSPVSEANVSQMSKRIMSIAAPIASHKCVLDRRGFLDITYI